MSLLRMSARTLKNLFTRPATRRFPAVVREPFALSRGEIKIEINNCIFCGMCSRRCPSQALSVKKEELSWEIDHLRCVVCRHCVDICPKKCLTQEHLAHEPVVEHFLEKLVQSPKPDLPAQMDAE